MLACWSAAQPQDAAKPLPPPQATVVIRRHELGAEVVEITMIRRDYPSRLLYDQAMKIAEYAGSTMRGLQVFRANYGAAGERFAFLKATFSVDGLADVKNGRFNLEPIVRAFAGAPAPFTILGLSINYYGYTPGADALKTYSSNAVRLTGSATSSPRAVEYRVALLSQDQSRIKIPTRVAPEPAEARPAPSRPNGPLLIVAIVAGSAAAGALVYFALLGRTRERA